MKGTDCTPEQLESARRFVVALGRNMAGDHLGDETAVSVKFGDFVRTVAWYGALRYMAGRDGTGGTLESPGEIDSCPSTTPETL